VWTDWANALIIVKPETVIRWHRAGFKQYWRLLSKRPGRPCADAEIRDLIRRMAKENPTWGAPRIHGGLLKLGFRPDIRPRMHGSTGALRIRIRNCPSVKAGTFVSTKEKSEGFGIPSGRDVGTSCLLFGVLPRSCFKSGCHARLS
jgi:hypothetical protein